MNTTDLGSNRHLRRADRAASILPTVYCWHNPLPRASVPAKIGQYCADIDCGAYSVTWRGYRERVHFRLPMAHTGRRVLAVHNLAPWMRGRAW